MFRTFLNRTASIRRLQVFAASPNLVSVPRNKMTTPSYSLNSLKRWSSLDKELPPVEKVTSLHVYDFDNTLFTTPLPNKQLWQGPTIGLLQGQETFSNGGWWHDSNILKSTGEGEEKETQRAWEGWWNEHIVELVGLSTKQPDAVSILLTGRSESGFAEIVQKMTDSKKLDFDMSVFKPEVGPANQRFTSTLKFKQTFLEDLVFTYKGATEIRVYEDRQRHVQGFRDFFDDLNQTLAYTSAPRLREPINSEVIEVAHNSKSLDPVTECAEVQRMINSHNESFRNQTLPRGGRPLEIKKTVFFTGYLISPTDSDRLLEVAGLPSSNQTSGDMKTMANCILITTRPCPQHVLDKVGGLGKKLRWRATAVGDFDNKVFAAKVEPVSSTERYYTEAQSPMVVLAVRGTGRPHESNRIQNWQQLPQEKAIEFETTVGEKVTLRIEQEQLRQENADPSNKRPKFQDGDFPPLGQSANPSSQHNSFQGPSSQQRRPYHDDNRRHDDYRRQNGYGPSRDGRRGGGGARGDGRSRGRGPSGPRAGYQTYRPADGADSFSRRGRGRGGYRSLDDQASRRANNFGTDGAGDDGLSY